MAILFSLRLRCWLRREWLQLLGTVGLEFGAIEIEYMLFHWL